jgi:hypothetical protein
MIGAARSSVNLRWTSKIVHELGELDKRLEGKSLGRN